VFLHGCYAVGAVLLSASPLLTFIVPPAVLVIIYTFLRSTFITLRRGRISWRETTYSLEDLKREMVP
ncbi:MAG: hypothetical protein AAB250_18425, partial [Bdellovibrionota bacterium]